MTSSEVHAVAPDEALAAAAGVLSARRAQREPHAQWRVKMGIWQQYGDAVITHNGPLTEVQRAWAAVLACGEGAVLAARSALCASGVQVTPPKRPQILLPFHRRVPALPDLDIRRTRLLRPEDVHRHRQPPRLTIARAAVDAASLLRRPDDVRAVLCAPVQQRRASVREVRAAALTAGPVRGRALVLRTLDELELGATGVHELRFSCIVRRNRLPAPTRQALRRRGLDGRSYLDVVWEQYALHVEIDGLAHLDALRWADDLDRSNELEIDKSERRLRFPGFLLLENEPHVVDQLRRALRRGGWVG